MHRRGGGAGGNSRALTAALVRSTGNGRPSPASSARRTWRLIVPDGAPRATAWWDSPCRPQFPAADLGCPAAFRWWGLNGSSVVCRFRDHHRRRTSVFSALAEVRRSGGYLVLEPGEDRLDRLGPLSHQPVTEQGCASGELRRRRRRYSARLAPGRPLAPEPKRPVRRASVENGKREPGGSMETKSPTLTVPGQPSGESHVRPQSRSPASAKRVSFSRRPHDQRGRVPPAGRAETQRRRRWRRSWPRATLSAAGFP